VGFNAMARDLGTWTDGCADDLITRSHFNLFYEVGMYLFKGSPRQALDFAMHMVAEPDVKPPRPVDPQLMINLQAAIERTKKTVSPSFFGYTFLRQCQKGVGT